MSHRYEDYQYLSIIDTALSPKWYVVLDDNKGWDFKVNNNNHLSYYRKQPEGATPTSSWYIMNSHMQELDTLTVQMVTWRIIMIFNTLKTTDIY